jgi:hypothetical protein
MFWGCARGVGLSLCTPKKFCQDSNETAIREFNIGYPPKPQLVARFATVVTSTPRG